MRWNISNRADQWANFIAKRHYTCQSPESAQFVPPGACLVLVTEQVDAVWVTSAPLAEYTRHAWAGSWVNSLFRREPNCPALASDLIREAVAATRWYWPDVPALGIVSFVDAAKVRRKRDPGRCYRKAGWTLLPERTKGGLLVYQLLPDEMPGAEPPFRATLRMDLGVTA
jgi:hypothetical protein